MPTALRLASERQTRHERVLRHAQPSRQLTARETQLLAILDRSMPFVAEQKRCECAECSALRARAFKCGRCGYRGEPFVNPCICIEQFDQWEDAWRKAVREATRKGIDHVFGEDVASCKARLARHRAKGRPGECLPSARGGDCCHGHLECPVCVEDMDNPAREEDKQHAWRIIRDMRAALGENNGRAVRDSHRIRANVLQDVEGYIAVDVSGGGVVGDDGGVKNRDGTESLFQLSVRSKNDLRALALALLRACDAPIHQLG